MSDEAEFNRFAAEEFISEYHRETGQVRRFGRMGDPFPDVILEALNGDEIGVEFVSIVLAFVNQEHSYFDRYRQAFIAALQPEAPRFRNTRITLQPHHDRIERVRPMRLPKINSPEGRALVADFANLLAERFEDLSVIWGGADGGALLGDLGRADGTLSYPVLSDYFGAILFHRVSHQEITSPISVSVDEPVITNPVILYCDTEPATAIRQALGTKLAKGSAYSSEVLVVHTLLKAGVADVSGIAMAADELSNLLRELLAARPELTARFPEIWFLNRYFANGKRLYRVN